MNTQGAVKWIMGIVAALFIAGATAWAGSIESRLANIPDRASAQQMREDLQYLRQRIDAIYDRVEHNK